MAVLKYYNPDSNSWELLSFPVGDTLPIGTIVDYDGTEVPPNWEKVGESGGGTKDGNEVEVTDTEPTDDTVDLWVDTSEEGEFFQVVDDLTSDSSTNALSAKQGKALNTRVSALESEVHRVTITVGTLAANGGAKDITSYMNLEKLRPFIINAYSTNDQSWCFSGVGFRGNNALFGNFGRNVINFSSNSSVVNILNSHTGSLNFKDVVITWKYLY